MIKSGFDSRFAIQASVLARTKRTVSNLFRWTIFLKRIGYDRPSGDNGTIDFVGGIEVAILGRKLLSASKFSPAGRVPFIWA